MVITSAVVKIQCIVGASLSIIYETSHHVYILIAHKHVSCTCHESNLQALQLTCLRMIGARYYKFHAKLTGAPCFHNIR